MHTGEGTVAVNPCWVRTLLLSCRILNVPQLFWCPWYLYRTETCKGLKVVWSPKPVRANQISMPSSVLWDGTVSSTSKEASPALLLCCHRDPWAECVDGSELSLMKRLSSPGPLKCRSFKGINHLLSQGEGVLHLRLKTKPDPNT